jgi:hypothetical protein
MKGIPQVIVVSLLLFSWCRLSGDEPKTTTSKTAVPATKSDPPVLVRVNGQPITESDLEFFAKTLKLAANEIPQRREQMIEQLIDRQPLIRRAWSCFSLK